MQSTRYTSPNTVQVHRDLKRSALTYAELYHIRVVGPRHERAHEQHGDPVHYSLALPLGAVRARRRHVSAPLADPNMPKNQNAELFWSGQWMIVNSGHAPAFFNPAHSHFVLCVYAHGEQYRPRLLLAKLPWRPLGADQATAKIPYYSTKQYTAYSCVLSNTEVCSPVVRTNSTLSSFKTEGLIEHKVQDFTNQFIKHTHTHMHA